MRKTLIISNDDSLKNFSNTENEELKYQISSFDSTTDPLDIVTQICSINPTVLILDDDFISPNSAHLLESIKIVVRTLKVIFITSDSSIELGRKIHSIGVKFYMIKPISAVKLIEFLKLIEKEESKLIY